MRLCRTRTVCRALSRPHFSRSGLDLLGRRAGVWSVLREPGATLLRQHTVGPGSSCLCPEPLAS